MYLARLIGTKLDVYPLIGDHRPAAWQFWSYENGAAAKAETKLAAIAAARKEITRVRTRLSRAWYGSAR